MKFNKASQSQIKSARMFSRDSGNSEMSVSQAMKHLDECFKLARGEMTKEQFTEKTGHEPHSVRF